MPIYEYECTACSQITEAVQRFSDPPLAECAHCHGPMRKLISRSTFHLKGSGWYVTDYSGKNQSTAAGGSSSTATQKDSTESPSAETKSSTSADSSSSNAD